MRSALIDTNLFLLLIVGLTDKGYISSHKRTKDFVKEDYDLLVKTIDGYELLWTTSHCLAEVSNLLRQTNAMQSQKLMKTMATFVYNVREAHIDKTFIFNNNLVFRLGITDTGFIQKAKRVTCSYTIDFDLYLELSKLKRTVVNFNHLRQSHLIA